MLANLTTSYALIAEVFGVAGPFGVAMDVTVLGCLAGMPAEGVGSSGYLVGARVVLDALAALFPVRSDCDYGWRRTRMRLLRQEEALIRGGR